MENSQAYQWAEGQGLLTCLAPFTSVILKGALPQYVEQLRQQPALANLPFERWEEVLGEAINRELLSPHPDLPGFLQLQPAFPHFLRSRLHDPGQAEIRRAVEAAFYAHYMGLGGMVHQMMTSNEAQQKQLGQALAHLEYENLVTALNLALKTQQSIGGIYLVLDEHWDSTQDHRRGIAVGADVAAQLETYPAELLVGQVGAEHMRVVQDLGRRQASLRQSVEAEQSYQRSLTIIQGLTGFDERQRALWSATSYHQLGHLAQQQRQWQQAHDYFQLALQIFISYNDRYSLARTYHHLGMVAQEQRQWQQAHDYFQLALQIFIAYNDRYSQASVYHQLGRVAEEQRQWQQAQDYFQLALQIFIAYNDRYAQARTYHQLGHLAQQQHQWEQAQDYFQLALQIYISYNDRYALVGTYHNLGIVAQQQHQWEQAQDYFQLALVIKIDSNDRYSQASSYHQLGVVAQQQRQWQQARDHLLKALETFAEFKDDHNLGITLHSLARLWRASADAGLPAAVAAVVGGAAEEVEEKFRGIVGGALTTDEGMDCRD
jgi:tetratricopeptide (TPR) repeat protein